MSDRRLPPVGTPKECDNTAQGREFFERTLGLRIP